MQISHPTLGSPNAMVTPQAELVVTGSINTINVAGTISTSNSTTTTLGANGSYVGAWEDIKNYSIVYNSLRTDTDSVTDGLRYEFSHDGISIDDYDNYTKGSGTNAKAISLQPNCRYFRINYINGATPQGIFRCQTLLRPNYGKPSSHRLFDNVNPENDAELVKSAITGYNAVIEEYENVHAIENSITTMGYAQHEIYEGKSFVFCGYKETLNDGDTLTLSITTPSGTQDRLAFSYRESCSAEHFFKIFEGATISGTSQQFYNVNRLSSNTNNSTVTLNPTIINSGTVLCQELLGAGKVGGESETANQWILKSGTTYLLQTESNSAGANASIKMNFFEVNTLL